MINIKLYTLMRTCCSIFIFGVILFIATLDTTVSFAEVVRIQTRSGEEGLGWLFGGNGPTGEPQCWVTAPAHVVAQPESGALEPFRYFDMHRGQGETGVPIAPVPLQDGKRTRAGLNDLAFAPVVVGRKSGQCLSRLGPVSLAYTSILRDTREYEVHQMFKTSSGFFSVGLGRKGVDQLGGSLLEFVTDTPKAQSLMLKGLSGATIMAHYNGTMVPIAMVLQLDAAKRSIRALKFDYIRNQFASMLSTIEQSPHATQATFEIVSASYTPIPPHDKGVTELGKNTTCWKAQAGLEEPGMAILVIRVDEASGISTIEATQAPACGTDPVQFWVDQRSPGAVNWTYVGAGRASTGADKKPCRLQLSGVKEFRLRFDARKTSVAISNIRVH